MSDILKEFNERRSAQNESVSKADFLPYKRFFALDTQTKCEGDMTAKTIEMLGLTASMVLRCNDCILYHLEKCVQCGCTRPELYEAMNVALVVGGSIVIPHLRFAFTALDQLIPHEAE